MAAIKKKPGPTPDMIEKVSTVARDVFFMEPTACLIGVARRTIYRWLKIGKQEIDLRSRGKEPDTTKDNYVDFVNALMTARHTREKELIQEIQDNKAWQSKAWLLERAFPDRWSSEASQIKILQKELKELKDYVLGKGK